VSRAGFVRALASSADLRALLAESLRAAPFEAYFWETVPFSPERGEAPFEFVVVNSPALAGIVANSTPFAPHFSKRASPIVSFGNLGGDAHLVVPAPATTASSYAHLAKFLRTAPAEQVEALWLRVAEDVAAWRAKRNDTLWVSTSGLGVHWLHVRLDARPKYYAYAPYREPHA
jgi:hypothetical protein